VTLGEDLAGVAALLGIHGVEAEVIEDQKVHARGVLGTPAPVSP
jgi:hypothetical protein